MAGLIPITLACFMAAAQTYDIPPKVLAAVMKTEGGKVGEYSVNTNKTRDLGPMQINDKVWVREIAVNLGSGNIQRTEDRLLNDGCFNVLAGAFILRDNIDRSKGNILEGVGRYHSWTDKHRFRYEKVFLENYKSIN